MQTFIYYGIIYIIEAFILKQYCSKLFLSKFSEKTQWGVISACHIILFAISILEIQWMNLAALICFIFITIFTLYEIKWYSAFFHVFIIVAIQCMSELIVLGISSQLLVDFYAEHSYNLYLILSALFSKLIYFCIVQIIIYAMKGRKQKDYIYEKGMVSIYFVPIGSLFIFLTLGELCIYVKLPVFLEPFISISGILLLIINLLIFWIHEREQQKSREYTELQLQLQKEYDMTNYYKQLIVRDEGQKILIHDIKKHLQVMDSLNEKGEKEQLSAYIDNIIHSPDLQSSVRFSDNELLNVILCRYDKECSDKKVDFRVDVRSGLLKNFTYEDITSLFSNLMDNAVEAAVQVSGSFIELSVSCQEKINLTVVSVINSCRSNPFDSKTGKLVTHKKDKMRHGYGIRSIERVVKKYNGEMTMYYEDENNEFHMVITIH
jgi:hypothetical protein